MRIALLLISILTISCSDSIESKNKRKIIDDIGRVVEIPIHVNKVLPLAASLTEVLYELKAADKVVGVTQNSDYPPEASSKPIVITWPNVNYEKILELKPDLVLVVNSLHSMQVVAKIESLGFPVVVFRYDRTEEIFNGIRTVGKIINDSTNAAHIADSLELLMNKSCVNNLNGPRVLHLIATGPIYAHGHKSFVNNKIECAGGVNPVGQNSDLQNPQISREYLLKINPQIIFGSDSSTMMTTFFNKYPELKEIDAYKTWDVYDLSDYGHSRPSPRVVSSTLFMKQIVQEWVERNKKN